jgi:hypothetical protein
MNCKKKKGKRKVFELIGFARMKARKFISVIVEIKVEYGRESSKRQNK